jgi:hypothetical protein
MKMKLFSRAGNVACANNRSRLPTGLARPAGQKDCTSLPQPSFSPAYFFFNKSIRAFS